MKDDETKRDQTEQTKSENQPRRIRLPGFVSDREIGLGDIIGRFTSSFVIKPCGGCGRRAAALNRRVVFSPWRRK